MKSTPPAVTPPASSAVATHSPVPKRPWGASVRDFMCLLSPRTWYGALLAQEQSPFAPIQVQVLIQSLLAVFIPAVFYAISSVVFMNGPGLFYAALGSPWTIANVRSGLPELTQFVSTCREWRTNRKEPLEAALTTLSERLDSKRAHRHLHYDIYMPPSASEPPSRTMLFIPGTLVPQTAYSEMAALLSDQGILVVVVSMEPLLLPKKHMGCERGRISKIIKQVSKKYGISSNPKDWSFGGHSSGAFSTLALARELGPSQVVLWGASPNFAESRVKLSNDQDVEVLVVQASCDEMCIPQNQDLQLAFEADLPLKRQFVMIQGGNHCQYASYEWDARFDGHATISREEQHQQLCNLTTNFLMNGIGSDHVDVM